MGGESGLQVEVGTIDNNVALTDDNELSHGSVIERSRSRTESITERRRLATPFTELVDELGISMPPLHVEPNRVLAEEPDFVERLLSMDGIQYVLGASCITQVLWCALGYYLYKRCTPSKEAG